MAIKLSLDEIIGLLSTEDGMKFSDFMTGTFVPEGTEILRKRIEFFWHSLDGMNITSDKFKLIMSSLLQIGVISQVSIDAFNAEIALQGATTVSYRKEYKVAEFPPEITDKLNWLASFATKDISVGFYEGIAYIEAEPNTFNCPYATEVI